MQPIHHEAAIKPIGFNPQIRIKKTIRLIGFVVITGLLLVLNAKGQTLPTGFSQVLVTNEISKPTLMAFAPDGRLFISQQTGELRIVKNGSLLAQPFISLSVYSSGERGLLGVAFDPNFTSNHYLYLYYTLPSGANNRISRFTANGDVVVTGSEVPILDLDPIGSSLLHFAGDMKFGPDGKLYVSTGDDVHGSNSQNLDSYHGKILRINPDGSVPAGNPYTSGSNQKLRVWASGLRNPYTLNFQPGTGRQRIIEIEIMIGCKVWVKGNT
jgi:glucose/arabinose dehydrogenase